QAANKLERELWIWSAAEGVRDGLSLLDKGPAIKGTERAEAGLNNLAGSKEGSICVALDLAEHLRDGRTLRVLREVIERFDKVGSNKILWQVVRDFFSG
ncbi:MAG: hypothetical protein ACYST6_20875, partial [Planctomycetota bacterium]